MYHTESKNGVTFFTNTNINVTTVVAFDSGRIFGLTTDLTSGYTLGVY